jgi:hypothetical protein
VKWVRFIQKWAEVAGDSGRLDDEFIVDRITGKG